VHSRENVVREQYLKALRSDGKAMSKEAELILRSWAYCVSFQL